MTSTPSPRVYDEAERRILDAAHRVFLRRGTSGARTQEIADEAGVNKSMLHYYFRTKENLAHAVFQLAAQEWLSGLGDVLETDAPLETVVREVIAAEVKAVEERPYLTGYLFAELHQRPERVHEALRATQPPNMSGLREHLEAAVAEGRIAPISAEEFIVNLVSLIVFPPAASGVFKALLGIEPDMWDAAMTDRTERLTEFFLRGVGLTEATA